MSKYVVLRDRRLHGGVPARSNLGIVNTDASTSLAYAFSAINVLARTDRINTLFVLCHGYAGENARANVSVDAGGMGLQLGRESVLHSNVSMWGSIKKKVRRIVVYACAAANTEPGNEGSDSDGRYLMGALALHTDADVYAADAIQWYGTHKNLHNGRFDWGSWEGKLMMFPAGGSAPTRVTNPPVELSQVMAGSAP
jgi:hypothetical protein